MPLTPRDPSFEHILRRYGLRLRRLEINHDYPASGTAGYSATYSDLSAATTWTPDFSAATLGQADQIGLTIAGQGIKIPSGWMAWCVVGFEIAQSAAPPTGEVVEWALDAGNGASVDRADMMLNASTQSLSAAIPAAAGWEDTDIPVTLGVVQTVLGTEFTPQSMYVEVMGIRLPTGGWPVSGDS